MKTRTICIGSAVKCTVAYNLLARLTGGLTLELEDGSPAEVIREAANGTASKETREATGDAMSDAEASV